MTKLMLALSDNSWELDMRNHNYAAIYGKINVLQYAHEHYGCSWDEYTCKCAAEHGHLDCLKYLHENGCSWNQNTCLWAAANGHLDCLQYAHENGCPWDEYTCKCAAENGHLDCLKYLHENGCPWNKNTCSWAAANGHLDCLQYAHENGCPWDEIVCHSAASGGHFDCLQYAHINECPWSSDIFNIVFQQWIRINNQTNAHDDPEKEQICKMYNHIKKYAKTYNCPQSFNEFVKTKTIEQTKCLAQELLAVALHPKRMAQWINED